MGIIERKEREKESRKESIIDAAQEIFFEKDLLLSTMDEIAEKAELAKGTLYLYYHSKEDLYLAVMVRGLVILRSMFQDVIDRRLSVVRTMVELSHAYTRFAREKKNYFRMLHFFNTPQLHKQVSPEMMESCDRVNRSLWEIATNVISQGITERLIRSDLNPVEIALILWSSATTLLMRIDHQYQEIHHRLRVDLNNTLRISNQLFLEAIFTERGKKELHAVLKHS